MKYKNVVCVYFTLAYGLCVDTDALFDAIVKCSGDPTAVHIRMKTALGKVGVRDRGQLMLSGGVWV